MANGSGARRKAREAALHLLYSQDANPLPIDQALESYRCSFSHDTEMWDFTADLVRGVWDHLAAIDDMITSVSRNWKLDRMARVDRNIMRLATYELIYRPDIPSRVSINEALEIAKRFSTEEARAFINGILDRIAAQAPPKN